jgi:Ca2+-transporting ATPase
MDYFRVSTREVFDDFKTNPSGISHQEAIIRLEKYGNNELSLRGRRKSLDIFLDQFKDFLILILIIASAISFGIGEFLNGIILLIVVIINVLMGFFQERKAEKALEVLKKIAAPKATIRRSGYQQKISSTKLVPGDIVILSAGETVPADLRLFKSANLEIDEAILTGESIPSTKHINSLPGPISLADRENMAYSGTKIVAGQGEGIVVTTGEKTEFGQIAEIVRKPVGTTLLQKRLVHLGQILLVISLILAGIIFILGLTRGYSIIDIFSYSVALLVSAVPEGLPTITTLALAMGVLKMAKQKAIVKKLPVIEALGSVDVICVDKTGTLTKNEMVIEKIITADNEIDIGGIGYDPFGKFMIGNQSIEPNSFRDLSQLIEIGDLANNASLERNKEKDKWQVFGDPTEGAFKVLAQKAGHKIKEHGRRIFELPFDSARQRMSVVYKEDGQKIAYIKGEPKGMLAISSKIIKKEMEGDIGVLEKEKISQEIDRLAKQGYRILGLGYKVIDEKDKMDLESLEKNIIFVGIVAMVDKPDEGVQEAILEAKNGKIQVVIITGDHKLTAQYVAQKIGLEIKEDEILTGDEVNKMAKNELKNLLDKIKIYARVSPLEKLKIVSAFKDKGKIVAVTGDGVNDAPALKKADVGIAMGLRGSDVSSEAADVVLADDKFSTIVNAIAYGRTLYENIRRFIIFLLSANFDEIALVLTAFALGLDQPYTALQILWVNLITDLFPAFALAIEKPKKEVMSEGPRDPQQNIIRPIILYAGLIGLVAAVLGFLIFQWGLKNFDIATTRTMVFSFAVFFELMLVFSLRSEKPFWRNRDFFGNRWVILAVIGSVILQIMAIYFSPLATILEAKPLGWLGWTVVIGAASIGFVMIEILKIFADKKEHKTSLRD